MKEKSTKPSSPPPPQAEMLQAGFSRYQLLTQQDKDHFKIKYGISTSRRAPTLSFFAALAILYGMSSYIFSTPPVLIIAIFAAIFVILRLGFKKTTTDEFIICKKDALILPALDEVSSGKKKHKIAYQNIAYVDFITICTSLQAPVNLLKEDPFYMADIHYSTGLYKRKIVIITNDLEQYEINEAKCQAYNAFSILFELFKEKNVEIFKKYR